VRDVDAENGYLIGFVVSSNTNKQGRGAVTRPFFVMKQQRRFQKDFSYGGYAIFSDNSRKPAFLQFDDAKITKVSLAKKETDSGLYSHSDCITYDLRNKRDINRLEKKGIIGFIYETPTELSLTFE